MYGFTADELLAQERFTTDARKAPDNARRGRFRAGWEDYTVRHKNYGPEILKRLTWTNLGYRMGVRFGEKSKDEMNTLFDMFAAHYRKSM